MRIAEIEKALEQAIRPVLHQAAKDIFLQLSHIETGDGGERVPVRSDWKKILHLVAAQFEVTPALMLGRNRKIRAVTPRWVTMSLCAELIHGMSSPDIGARFGRDHTSVLYGINKIDEKCQYSESFAAEVDAVRQAFKALMQPVSEHRRTGNI